MAMSSTSDAESKDNTVLRIRGLSKAFGPKRRFNLRERRFVHACQEAIQSIDKGEDRTEVEAELGVNVALRKIEFDVHQGEIFVLMGLSGCGKSTLLRCVNRLIRPTQGSIEFYGEDIVAMDKRQLRSIRRERISMVFQHFGLLPHRNVLENVAFGLEVQGISRQERYEKSKEMLEIVGLSDRVDAFPHELSGGMKQRVGLARALVNEPDLLLMDEPFSALDPLIRTSLQDEIIDIQERLGLTILLVTHDLDEALRMGDRIAILSTPDEEGGNIMQIGSPADIALRPESEYVAQFSRDLNRAKVLKARDVMMRFGTVLKTGDKAKDVVDKMNTADCDILPCIDDDGCFIGYVDRTSLQPEIEQNTISSIINSTDRLVKRNTPLEDLFALFLVDSGPIFVVDAKNHPVGLVTGDDLLVIYNPEVVADEEE
jgi:glycine betaine/proline transport system ATP-binding protein